MSHTPLGWLRPLPPLGSRAYSEQAPINPNALGIGAEWLGALPTVRGGVNLARFAGSGLHGDASKRQQAFADKSISELGSCGALLGFLLKKGKRTTSIGQLQKTSVAIKLNET